MAVLRQPPRTPRRVASGPLDTNTPSTTTKHKKFDEDEEDEGSELLASVSSRLFPANEQNSDSDSDEAPEEESNSNAAESLRRKEQEVERLQLEEVQKDRAKRRERDARLKEQKQNSNSSKLLPDSIIEAFEEEQKASTTSTPTTAPLTTKKPVHIKLDNKKLPKNKTLYKKGPVLVKVLTTAKKLAPQTESIVNITRESFLNRKSVYRR